MTDPLRAALEQLRDDGYQPMHNGRPSCPFCNHFIDEEDTHAKNCLLLALAADPTRPGPAYGPCT